MLAVVSLEDRVTARRALSLALALLLLGGALAPAGAEPRRVGVLGPAEARFDVIADGLRHGLADHGQQEGALEVLEERVARGDRAEARAAVGRLVQRRVEALLAIGSQLARVARDVAPGLPVVFLTPGDPVAAGLVASLARPGGNMTGMTFEYPELSAKRLELLRDMVPPIRSVLVVYDPRDASPRQHVEAARQAGSRLGLVLHERHARSRQEIAQALEAVVRADALLVVPGGFTAGHLADLVGAAGAARRPAMVHARTPETMGALASYGADEGSVARQAARLVARILAGTAAGDLPVERPARLEFVIDLGAAAALGITVPPPALLRADRVLP